MTYTVADRQNNYDILRIVSTIAVIVIHVNWGYFSGRYESADGTVTWVIESLLNIITRFSVPCFVMMSGAFILNNAENEKAIQFYKKTSYKIFLPVIIIIFAFAVGKIMYNVITHSIFYKGLGGILRGSSLNLWYIYMLAGLYFFTPAFIRLKKALSWKQYKLLAGGMVLWAVLSQATSSQEIAYSIGVVGAFFSYYMLGDVLYQSINISKEKQKVSSCLC